MLSLSTRELLAAVLRISTLTFLLAPGLASGQDQVSTDDFEADEIGGFPEGGWSDLALLLDPEPSALTTVVQALDPAGDEQQSLQIRSAPNTTQGIYRFIEPQTVSTVTADVRIEQYMAPCENQLPVEIGFAEFSDQAGNNDPFWWRIAEVHVGAGRTFTAYSGPDPFEQDVVAPVETARWYRATVEVDTIEGTLSIDATDLESSVKIAHSVFAYNGVAGRAFDTVFIASSQRGTCGDEPRGRVLVDNVVFTSGSTESPPDRFVRGDCNDDGESDLSDAVCTLGWLFLGDREPNCVAATDANGDEGVDLSDPVWVLSFLFLGGPSPVDPYPDCGTSNVDADADLGCKETACP